MMTPAMTVPVRAGADMRLIRAAVFSAVCVTLSAAGHAMASGASIPPWALLAGWLGVLVVAASLAGRERSLPGIATALLGGQLGLHAVFSAGQWCAQPAPAGRSAQVMALAARLVCDDGGRLRLTPATAARIVRQAGIDPATAALPPAASGPSGLPGTPGMPGMTGSMGGAAADGAHGAMTMGYSLPMLCGHLAAALVAGWLLRRGEAALWRLLRLSAQCAAQVAALLPARAVLAAVHALAALTALLTERVAAARRPRRTAHPGRRLESVALRHSVIRRGPPRVVLAA